MYLRTNLKLGEVTNLSDARYAAGIGAKFIGFSMSPSHAAYIAPDKVMEILGWVEGIVPVMEWGNEPAEAISDTCERLGITHAQLNVCEPACSAQLGHLCLIQNLAVDEHTHLSELIGTIDHIQKFTDYYMLSFRDAETQAKYLDNKAHRLMIMEFCRDYPVILNFQFDTENLLPLIEEFKPFGINLKGGQEDKPGFKDFDELNDLVQLLEK